MRRTIEVSSCILMVATVVLVSILASGTAHSQETTSPSAKASTEFVRLTREAVDTALAPGASQREIKRAEELLYGVGWMGLYGNTGVRLFMQNWYLAMPAGGPDITRFNALREVANYEIDTTVEVSPEYLALVQEGVDLATAENGGPADFKFSEASVIALGWMALYGNDDESSNLAKRLGEIAFNAWPGAADVYMTHTSGAYFEMMNLYRYAMPSNAPASNSAAQSEELPAPQPGKTTELLATGSGEVSSLEGTFKTEFELYGNPVGFEVLMIGFKVKDMALEITVTDNSDGGSKGKGYLTPCEDGVCACSLSGDEATGTAEGTCDNSAHPEHGQMKFRFQIADGVPPQQQFTLLTSGPGQITGQGETRDSTFEILGDDEQARLIKIDAGGDLFEVMVDVNDTGSSEGTGQFSPCEGGNCPCNMSEVEYGIHGVCSDLANPDYGELQFSIWLNGEPESPRTAVAPLKTRQVKPSEVQSRTPQAKVPVSMRLSLRSNTVLTRTSYFQKTYNGPGDVAPPIFIDVTFSDGSTMGPYDYHHEQFADNVIFDDVTGDPNDLINVSYWDINRKLPASDKPGPGRYASQLMAPGYGTGNATLTARLRDAPGISDSVSVTVVGAPAPSAAPAPVARPPAARRPAQQQAAQPTPVQPQLTLITSGSGDFKEVGAEFGVWGLNGKASEIRIQTGRGNYVFSIDENSSNDDKLRGRLTPCSGDGCSCEMFEEGQDYYMGFCDAADPQNQINFSIRLN